LQAFKKKFVSPVGRKVCVVLADSVFFLRVDMLIEKKCCCCGKFFERVKTVLC